MRGALCSGENGVGGEQNASARALTVDLESNDGWIVGAVGHAQLRARKVDARRGGRRCRRDCLRSACGDKEAGGHSEGAAHGTRASAIRVPNVMTQEIGHRRWPPTDLCRLRPLAMDSGSCAHVALHPLDDGLERRPRCKNTRYARCLEPIDIDFRNDATAEDNNVVRPPLLQLFEHRRK